MENSSNQKIGLATATIVGMNAMIGAGIFAVPAALAKTAGPAGILTFAFVILAVLCMALTLAKVASQFPQEGSFYLYAKQWGGHRAGVIATTSYLIGLCIAMGLLTQFAGSYLQTWFPSVSSSTLGAITLIALVVLNMIGVKLSQAGQMVLIVCTTFPLLATIILCFSQAQISNLFPFMPENPLNLITATRAVIFGFFGFESAASLFSVVKNPEKNVPKALTLAIFFVGIIYLLFVGSIIMSIPLSEFSNPMAKLPNILANNFPKYAWLTNILNFSILSAVIGTLHSMIWGVSMLTVSFFKQLSIGKSKTFSNLSDQNKQRAILAGLGSIILINSLTIHNPDLFFSITALCIVFAYLMSMATIFKLKQTKREKFTTAAGFLAAGIIILAALQGLAESVTNIF